MPLVTWASESWALWSCSSSRHRSSSHICRPSGQPPLVVVRTLPAVRLAAAYHRCVQLRVLPHGGEPIQCDPSGCCMWTARGSVAAARRRLYELSRGALPTSARIENVCRSKRCVNVDHLRVTARVASRTRSPNIAQCRRGHDLTPENVVRHRDGRVAYCRLCRNERRRERYRDDPAFAGREITRQRVLRRASPGRVMGPG